MQSRKRRNDRTRLILGMELAVVLPAAALVIISGLYVNSIQRNRSVEAAIQRDFNQVLAISEKQINQKAYDLTDDIRNEFPGPEKACSVTLDRILAEHPYAAHVFFYSPERGLIFRSQPGRASEAGFQIETEELTHMMDGWMKLEYKDVVEEINLVQKRKGVPDLFYNNYTSRGDKHVYQPVGLFLVSDDEASGGDKAIGGMVFDADFLHDKFFPEMLETVMARSHNEAETEKNPAVMMIHSRNEWEPLAASAGWDGGMPAVERNMENVFTGLTMAIKLRGTTLEAMGKKFVRTAYLILGALTLILAGGIALAHRNLSKEMALARLKSDFVSNVSHELRTPLSLIRLYAETLELGRISSPEKYQEYYRIIRKESERLTGLINNILDFSRIEAGRKEYDFRETDLRELVHTTLDSYRYQIEQSGFAFEEKIEADVPPIRVDREAMSRSLLNLVNNALKYSQDQKYIGVNLYRSNGSVKLEVIDRGIGIPPAEQGKIFEKFYRVGNPLVHNTKGSGLGLSLVQHIVRAHGGNVIVDSAPGQGSKFTITLPVNAGTTTAA